MLRPHVYWTQWKNSENLSTWSSGGVRVTLDWCKGEGNLGEA